VAPLDGRARTALPDSAFAYIDSQGRRRLPINDAAHVRNALARFEQTAFEDGAARERARERLLKAARKFRISPLGFFDGQIRKERRHSELEVKAARMARLPKGMVTFLMADIEGSTPLAHRLGDAWPGLLREAWRLLGSCVQRAGGEEVDARGDEYVAVFRRTTGAVKAAISVQLEMSRHKWREGLPLRVRIGLHAGTPAIVDAAYEGIVVHTVARVCSAGHGGQILISSAVRDLLSSQAVPGLAFRPLGRYLLAGLPKPEALDQLEAPGLATEFPKLRARLAPTRSRVPAVAKA
jgi:class 3 adenylate cyclase